MVDLTLTRRQVLTAVAALGAAGVAASLTACGSDSADTPAGGATAGGSGMSGIKIAGILSGSATDADYNSLGLLALQALEKKGAKISHSESVAVPDVERVMKEYLADGSNIIWTHGSQFYDATAKLAKDNPDVHFIGEFDDQPKSPLPNVWVIDRNFHTAFYPLGVLAGASTKSGKIGYLGGLSLPFSYSEVHAMNQALADSGSTAKISPVWTGDFNDPAKAQQITSQLMDAGNDVIVGSLNLGMVGAFNATKARPAGAVLVTAKYTDKSQFDPEHYGASCLYDFVGPLDAIVGKIVAGTTTGYYPLGFDTGVSIKMSDKVSAAAKTKVDAAVADIKSGKVKVTKNLTPIK